MTEQKQSKIPSFAAIRKRGSARRKSPREKTSSLTGVCSSGGAGVGDKRVGAGAGVKRPYVDQNQTTPVPQTTSAIEVFSSSPSSATSTGKKITNYVLGPLQMHCLREFAAGRCDRLEITPAYKVPFIEGVSVGRSSENRVRPAVMRCERRIYFKETGALAYVSLKVIDSKLRASRCSATIERELGIRYEDGEDSGVF